MAFRKNRMGAKRSADVDIQYILQFCPYLGIFKEMHFEFRPVKSRTPIYGTEAVLRRNLYQPLETPNNYPCAVEDVTVPVSQLWQKMPAAGSISPFREAVTIFFPGFAVRIVAFISLALKQTKHLWAEFTEIFTFSLLFYQPRFLHIVWAGDWNISLSCFV